MAPEWDKGREEGGTEKDEERDRADLCAAPAETEATGEADIDRVREAEEREGWVVLGTGATKAEEERVPGAPAVGGAAEAIIPGVATTAGAADLGIGDGEAEEEGDPRVATPPGVTGEE